MAPSGKNRESEVQAKVLTESLKPIGPNLY